MPVSIVVGLQWGDEGKGKMVDHLAEKAVAVARFSGGANAGHTVVTEGRKFALHLLPSGLVRRNVVGIIGSACVMDPVTILEEIRSLEGNGISIKGRLKISGKINLTHPGYRWLEKQNETDLAKGRIGTTGRGIGPTYERKYMRTAIRLEDVFNMETFKTLVDYHTEETISLLNLGSAHVEKLNSDVEKFIEATEKVAGFADDVSLFINKVLKEDGLVIAEGAQGSLLDPDHGSYPFVTCGQCVSGAACTSLGFGPTQVDDVVGILKAYTTRVGSGPFPTELDNDTGERIRQAGHEFGTTTGRPRRCGWLDGVLANYTARINGCTSVTLTLLDVLSGFSELKICTGYKDDKFTTGRSMDELIPVYETFSGWTEDIRGETEWENLPAAAKQYVLAVEKIVGVPVTSVSTGPGRDDVIWR
ncbi:MAG: adenylosuccinate synthase [Candidatus Sabulitectum sp.]|nr:adenylosuccinate synthase [Candidatus Sabulitectum sp.]